MHVKTPSCCVLSWLEEAEPGEAIQIVVGEMDEAEYDKMPEYMGP